MVVEVGKEAIRVNTLGDNTHLLRYSSLNDLLLPLCFLYVPKDAKLSVLTDSWRWRLFSSCSDCASLADSRLKIAFDAIGIFF